MVSLGGKMVKQQYALHTVDAVGINQHGEYLTESGKLIIDELLNECIDYIKEGHITRCVNH